MEVTIILEDVNLFSQPKAITAKKSIRKSLRLSVNKRIIVYALAYLVGLICVIYDFIFFGLALILFFAALFYMLEYLQKVFHIEINFSKEDELDKMLREDLYD